MLKGTEMNIYGFTQTVDVNNGCGGRLTLATGTPLQRTQIPQRNKCLSVYRRQGACIRI